MKAVVSLLFLFLIIQSNAQSLIDILPRTIHLNFDTTGASRYAPVDERNFGQFNIRLDIANSSNSDIEIDSNLKYSFILVPKVLHPDEKGILIINALGQLLSIRDKNDTIKWYDKKEYNLQIPFTMNGKLAVENIAFINTYEKPKLVDVDTTIWQLDTVVKQIVDATPKSKRVEVYIHKQITVKNRTKEAFIYPEQFVAWNDSGDWLNGESSCFQIATRIARIGIDLNMGEKQRFGVHANLIIHSIDYSNIDIIFLKLKSDYANYARD